MIRASAVPAPAEELPRARQVDPALSLRAVRPTYLRTVPATMGLRGHTRAGPRLLGREPPDALVLRAQAPGAGVREGRQAPVLRRRQAHDLQVRGRAPVATRRRGLRRPPLALVPVLAPRA